MTSLQPYPEYKDSGVEWLGKIPDNWQACPLGSYLNELDRRLGPREAPPLLAVSQTRGVIRRDLITDKEPRAEDLSKYKICEDRQIVLSRFNAYRGALGLAHEQGVVSPDYMVVAVRNHAWPSFIEYLLRSDYLANKMKQTMGGLGASDPDASGFSRISAHDLGRFTVPHIPLSEQRAIASFLDHETAEIDAFIADQQELIGLLNERRAATITQAVTKGLDPNVPMKDSGVEWLGEVPAHWDVDKATRIGRVFGSEAVREEDVNSFSGVPFLKVSSLAREGFEPYPPEWFVRGGRATAVRDFIAFPKRGAAIFTNKVNIVREPAALDPNLMGWKLINSCDLTYFAYVLQLMRLEEIADVSTVPQINTKHIAALRLPKPPTEEQLQIVSYLHRETAGMDAAISDAKEAIELSQERRAALISAAVTGNIDVRDHPAAKGAA